MDNNFVNIDDLVRQRLGGGQEPERSGAWSRMEQLLDKEDRRKPLGLYWKRAMSYCGVAMLLAAVSVGGYEMTSAFRAQGDAAANPAGNSSVATSNNSDVVSSVATFKKAIAANNGSVVAASPAHNTVHTTAKNVVAADQNVHNSGAHNAASAAQNGTVAATGSVAGNNGHNDHAFASLATTGTTTDKHNNKSTFADDVNKNRANMIGAANATNTHHDQPNAIDDQIVKTSISNKGDNHITTVKSTNNTIATTGIKDPAAPVFPKNDHIIDHGHGSAYVSQVKQLPLAAGKNNAGVPFKPAAVVAPVLAHNVAATAAHTPMVVKPIAGKKVLQRIVMQETRTNSYEGRSETRLDTISIDRITQELARIKESNDAARSATASTAQANKAGNYNAATPANAAHTTAGKSGNNNKGNQPPVTNNYAAQQGSTAGTPAIASAGKAANTNNGTLAANAGYNAAVQNGSDNLAAAQNGDIQASTDITPNAAPSAPASTPPTENKPVITKKKHGVNMAESLSNMFNEVKYKLNGAQFGTGLTAGINGTFFGPNSFKGFQFGITGAFELDDTWSVMAELKYFHRMNNDYSMDVTYNKYRPTAGGYFKDSTLVSYSFSTLHSFELPLTMRYTAARFSFFLGGNFLYTFAVNTGGAEQLVDPNVMPVVASNTANTAPAIKESDFGARFGVGYTCGIAYRVAPNVLLDFRNVQTVWDNAKATGSQAVSNQLYKSPSLQFSLFYRLGAGKNNKD